MKVFAVLAAATVAAVSAADCDLLALAPVAGTPDAIQCGKDADGYSVVTAQYPTATQLPKMCLSTACNNLLAALKKAAPTECTITLATPPVPLYEKLLTPIETACEKVKKDAAAGGAGGATTAPVGTSAAPATTTAAPGATTAAPTATSAAPATTTAAPAATTEAPKDEETSSASGSGPSEDIQSPAVTPAAANATTPAPAATKSSASSVVAAAGAVVVAVAASLF